MSVRVPGGYNPANVAITGGTILGAPMVGGPRQSLSKAAVPVISTPSGTMGNNGAFTSGTAFPRTIAKCFLWFTANQIAAGVAAGFYYAEGSSTTAFTVFNNTYTAGMPSFPASAARVPFVTTGPGATTGDTTEQGVAITLGGNVLGPNGLILPYMLVSCNATAGAKTGRVRLAGLAGTQYLTLNSTAATTIMAGRSEIWNNGVTNAQIGPTAAGINNNGSDIGVGATTAATSSVDTTASTTVVASVQKAVATDYAILEAYDFELSVDGT